ncbi:MAG: hypothetical protein ACYC1E_13150 [Propionibacteriaceae bacterium]
MRDVRLVSIEAYNHAQPSRDATVEVAMDDWAFRAEPGVLFVRLASTVRYFKAESETDSPVEEPIDQPEREPAELGRLVVAHTAELELEGDPEAVTREQIDELVEMNLMFIMFPYVRATVHRLSSDLQLPPIVLPYLRRNVGPAKRAAGNPES